VRIVNGVLDTSTMSFCMGFSINNKLLKFKAGQDCIASFPNGIMDNFYLIFKHFQVNCVDPHSLMGTAYTDKSFASDFTTDYLSVTYVTQCSMFRMMTVKDFTSCTSTQAMIAKYFSLVEAFLQCKQKILLHFTRQIV